MFATHIICKIYNRADLCRLCSLSEERNWQHAYQTCLVIFKHVDRWKAESSNMSQQDYRIPSRQAKFEIANTYTSTSNQSIASHIRELFIAASPWKFIFLISVWLSGLLRWNFPTSIFTFNFSSFQLIAKIRIAHKIVGNS